MKKKIWHYLCIKNRFMGEEKETWNRSYKRQKTSGDHWCLPHYQLPPFLLFSVAPSTLGDCLSSALATGEQGPKQRKHTTLSCKGMVQENLRTNILEGHVSDFFFLLSGRALFHLFNEIPSKAWLFCLMF